MTISTPMSGTQHNITFQAESERWIEFTGIQSLNLILDSVLTFEYEDGTSMNLENWHTIPHENWMLNRKTI